MRGAAHSLAANLAPADEIAVVSFSAEAHLLLPFSTDRALLDRRHPIETFGPALENSSESNIYESVFLAARELFRGRTGRKAIVLLTDGKTAAWASPGTRPARSLVKGAAASRSRSTMWRANSARTESLSSSSPRKPPALDDSGLARGAPDRDARSTKNSRREGMPHYTLYLAELARRVGGQLYFLREIGNLSEIYRRHRPDD